MTSLQAPAAAGSSIFRDDERVIQAHPTLNGATPPLFGNTECWDLNGVLRCPANFRATGMRIWFRNLDPDLNLTARELAMIWLNPRHPNVLSRGLHLAVTPLAAVTVSQRIGHFRALAQYGADRNLPSTLAAWSDDDFKDYVKRRCEAGETASAVGHCFVIKSLFRLRKALSGGGIERDPWPGRSTNSVVNQPVVPDIKTPVIPPETWFPLVRAAWTYIDVFAADIIRAVAHWQAVQEAADRATHAEGDRRLSQYLADPTSRIPLHPSGARAGQVNWSIMSLLVGVRPHGVGLFDTQSPAAMRRRALVETAAADRGWSGLPIDLAHVTRPDGSRGPWQEGLTLHDLWLEQLQLRNACYIFVAALSMMRDCEIREITKGSVVEHFSNPAVKATKRKLDPDLPTRHWWIIEPVAKAIDVASRMSLHDELAFANVSQRRSGEGFTSATAIRVFIAHVNRNRHLSGLDAIPDTNVTPHMFRRTMAMLTHDFPGSEIAVGMQLKHAATRALANRTTQGYMDHDPSWARHLDTAIANRRFERLSELFDADSRGETIGYGPGADRLRDVFAAVRQKGEQLRSTIGGQRGDRRVEHDLLRRTKLSIRFGTLNHCTMSDNDPSGAKCLEDATAPAGHIGPLIDRCQPSRCANSVIAPEHLPIWQAEVASIDQLLQDRALAPNRRAHLQAQRQEAQRVINKAGE